jgi:hypothetical protein
VFAGIEIVDNLSGRKGEFSGASFLQHFKSSAGFGWEQ